jgi:hypothetical protein
MAHIVSGDLMVTVSYSVLTLGKQGHVNSHWDNLVHSAWHGYTLQPHEEIESDVDTYC